MDELPIHWSPEKRDAVFAKARAEQEALIAGWVKEARDIAAGKGVSVSDLAAFEAAQAKRRHRARYRDFARKQTEAELANAYAGHASKKAAAE